MERLSRFIRLFASAGTGLFGLGRPVPASVSSRRIELVRTNTLTLSQIKSHLHAMHGLKPHFVGEISGLTKTEAEDLLDWLENHGVHDANLDYLDSAGFRVRYR